MGNEPSDAKAFAPENAKASESCALVAGEKRKHRDAEQVRLATFLLATDGSQRIATCRWAFSPRYR